MKLSKGCKAVTIQIDEKLLKRAKAILLKGGWRGITLAELIRRGTADLVEKMEKGQDENRSWGSHFDGSRKSTSY